MRNLVKMMLLVVLTAGISSCQKIKSIFDVDFDTTLSGDLDIDIPQSTAKSAANFEFEKFVTVDPLDDEDIADYVDNIKEFAVNGVVVEVLSVSTQDVVFLKGTSFVIKDNSITVSWTLENDWTVTEGTTIDLEDTGNIYESVVDILTKKGQFQVGASGVSSKEGVFITLSIGIDTKVTASPL